MRSRSFAILGLGVGVGLGSSLAGCAVEPARDHLEQGVIGGTPTPSGLYPGVGALYSEAFGQASCTGTLIAPDVVLTAAHCVDPTLVGSEIPGFTLAHDTVTSQPAFTPGLRTFKHPLFELVNLPTSGLGDVYDIGLVFLAAPITEVAPIKMPSAAEMALLTAGTTLDLVGYGVTTVGGFETGVMYNGQAPLISLGTSELQISNPGDVQNCYGDSGGPALVDLGGGVRVVGVVSRSFDGKECTQGAVDTRVDSYAELIYTESGTCAVDDDRCAPLDDGGDDDAGGGGCASSRGSAGGAVLVALGLAIGTLRRRRRG